MKNLKISQKLILSFLILSLITTIVGCTGIYSMIQMKASGTKLYEKQTAPLSVISDLTVNLEHIKSQSREYIVYYKDPNRLQKIETDIKQYQTQLQKDMKDYAPTISTAASKALFDEANKMYDEQLMPALNQIASSAQGGDAAGATTQLENFNTVIEKMENNYNQCMVNRINNAKANNDSNNQMADAMITVLIAVMLAGVAGSIAWGIMLARALSRPINEMASAAENIAEGNLNVAITYVSRDEIGSLANSLKSAAHTLQLYIRDISSHLDLIARGDLTAEISQEYAGDFAPIKDALVTISDDLNRALTTISNSAEQVNSGASQMSGGAQELAQGTTEQAGTVEELAAASSDISDKVKENAESVRVMAGYVDEAVAQIGRGNTQMDRMLSAMNDISTSSNEIGKIIKAIDDIAFQTNILALNAAVEAARAGAAGKGFAVVADEVRNLAVKAADAAKQTTALIDDSVQNVQHGTEMANSTAKALNDAAEKIHLVGETIAKVSSASDGQALAIRQITIGVEQVSSVVQTNSATAEESAAASEELSAQADMLLGLVNHFRLKGQPVPEEEQF